MADRTSLNSTLNSIFVIALGDSRNETKRARKIAGLTEQLLRSAREIYTRGFAAEFETKIEMARMLRDLDRAQHVLSFVEYHARNPLLKKVDVSREFGENEQWLFEQLTCVDGGSTYMLRSAIGTLLKKLQFVSRDHYVHFLDGSFFTLEELQKIWEERLLD